MTKTYLEAYKPSIIKVSPETWNDKLLQHNIQLSKQINIKHQNNLKKNDSSAFKDWPSRHLPASWGIRGLSKIAVDDFPILFPLTFLPIITHQPKVCGGNDPVNGDGGEKDESCQQGQAEVEAAGSQARTSHAQNLFTKEKSQFVQTSRKRHFGSPKLKSQKLGKITRNIFWKKLFWSVLILPTPKHFRPELFP